MTGKTPIRTGDGSARCGTATTRRGSQSIESTSRTGLRHRRSPGSSEGQRHPSSAITSGWTHGACLADPLLTDGVGPDVSLFTKAAIGAAAANWRFVRIADLGLHRSERPLSAICVNQMHDTTCAEMPTNPHDHAAFGCLCLYRERTNPLQLRRNLFSASI